MTDNSKKISLQVEGMTCANCALGITRSVQKSGGENVTVNYISGEAHFNLTSPEKLAQVIDNINALGYKVIDSTKKEDSKSNSLSLEKKFYICLVFTFPLFVHMFLPFGFLHHPIVQLILCIPVFIVGCIHFGRSAWGSAKTGFLNMDVLIIIGSGSAFIYSLAGTILYYGTEHIHNYLFYETAATIITLVLLGNVLEHKSVHQTTESIRELSKLQQVKARKIELHNNHEHLIDVDFENIKKGDVLQVNTGDKIPVDGIIIQGRASVDESALTGESLPVEKNMNDLITGGTLIINGNLRMKAERVGRETTMSQIIELVKNAQQNKPAIQKLGDKVSSVFVPIVLGISALTFILSYFVFGITAQQSMMHSIAVLVISCPCAMGLATPTALIVGIGRAARNGILIKGGNTLEIFASIKNIVFDKTGTLTTGNFKIKKIHLYNNAIETYVKDLLVKLESESSHPIAQFIVKTFSPAGTNIKLNTSEQKGLGITADDAEGNKYTLGSYRTVQSLTQDDSHNIYLTKNGLLLAALDIEDELKADVPATIKTLNQSGITTLLLSGDSEEHCRLIAKQSGISEVYSRQLPDQKLAVIKRLNDTSPTAMVGDGINDAPALAQAAVGVSIGNASQAAIQSAQIILLNSKSISQLLFAYNISTHTLTTIRQNLFWAFFYNVIAIPIAAIGLLNPMVAALSMAFSDVIVIGNSIRLKYKKIA